MIASFTGLLLTVSLAGDIKEQNNKAEKKNDFYLFTHLLPVLSQNTPQVSILFRHLSVQPLFY
jgi:hypothetical protein